MPGLTAYLMFESAQGQPDKRVPRSCSSIPSDSISDPKAPYRVVTWALRPFSWHPHPLVLVQLVLWRSDRIRMSDPFPPAYAITHAESSLPRLNALGFFTHSSHRWWFPNLKIHTNNFGKLEEVEGTCPTRYRASLQGYNN